MRIDHWIKNLFVLPGAAFALILIRNDASIPEASGIYDNILIRLLIGIAATCLIASANYVINEWLDAEFDRYHPVKKHRSVVENDVKAGVVYLLYAALTAAGFLTAFCASAYVLLMEIWLWVMGILYNVKPVRTKDIPIVDVLTESINNAIRFLIGWFCVTGEFLPPSSLIIGFWMAGAFLMDIKRFSEYRMIGDKTTASLYRRSFAFYTERSLLCAGFFYAMMSCVFLGIFLIKYRVEFIILIPFLIGLFSYYLYISYKEDSAAQAPEKLYREKGLMLYVVLFCVLFVVLLNVDIPAMYWLLNDSLVAVP